MIALPTFAVSSFYIPSGLVFAMTYNQFTVVGDQSEVRGQVTEVTLRACGCFPRMVETDSWSLRNAATENTGQIAAQSKRSPARPRGGVLACSECSYAL